MLATLITDVKLKKDEWPIPRICALCGTDQYTEIAKADLDRLTTMDMRIRLSDDWRSCQELFTIREIARSKVRPFLLAARATCLILDEVTEGWGTAACHQSVLFLGRERKLVESLDLFETVKAGCLVGGEILEVA